EADQRKDQRNREREQESGQLAAATGFAVHDDHSHRGIIDSMVNGRREAMDHGNPAAAMFNPDRSRRIAVIGTSCSGKTTLARRLAVRLDCPHLELDAFHWGPDWTETPREQFREAVDIQTRQPAWVSCG